MSETSWKPNLSDVVIAVGTAVALLLLTQIAMERGSSPPDLFASI